MPQLIIIIHLDHILMKCRYLTSELCLAHGPFLNPHAGMFATVVSGTLFQHCLINLTLTFMNIHARLHPR